MRIELEDSKKIENPETEVLKPEEPVRFSDLSGKKKAEYIWDYYKWWFIGGIIVLISLIIFIRDYRENSKPDYLRVEMLNTYLGYDRSNSLYDDFVREAGIDLSKEHLIIGTETTLSTESFDSTMIAYQQRLIASYAAQDIDVVIGPKKIIEGPANCDCYADFGKIIPEELMAELEDRGYEMYYYDPAAGTKDDPLAAPDPEDGTVKAYCAGVYLDNCSYLNALGENGAYPVAETEDDRPVFTIAANSLRTDHAIEFLRFLIR